LGIVSALCWTKRFDLVSQVMDRLAREEMILVVLGSGEKNCHEEMFARMAKAFPARLREDYLRQQDCAQD